MKKRQRLVTPEMLERCPIYQETQQIIKDIEAKYDGDYFKFVEAVMNEPDEPGVNYVEVPPAPWVDRLVEDGRKAREAAGAKGEALIDEFGVNYVDMNPARRGDRLIEDRSKAREVAAKVIADRRKAREAEAEEVVEELLAHKEFAIGK